MASGAAGSRQEVSEVLSAINSAWAEGRPEDLEPHLHEEITMALPGSAGSVSGKAAFLAGFEDFARNARLLSFDVTDRTVDVCGPVAVASFRFTVLYERAGGTFRSTGRDLWVLGRMGDRWLAVWRTMLDVAESEAAE